MVRPSPVLCSRLRFTTKQVGFGFYKGNKTGSVGAHTEYGGYVVDWRKVRNYNVPQDLESSKLTPYVSRTIGENREPPAHIGIDVVNTGGDLATAMKPVLQKVMFHNSDEVRNILRYQLEMDLQRTDYAPTVPHADTEIESVEELDESQPYAAEMEEARQEPLEQTTEIVEEPGVVSELQQDVPDLQVLEGEIQETTINELKNQLMSLRNPPRRFKESKAEKRDRKSVKDHRKLLAKLIELQLPVPSPDRMAPKKKQTREADIGNAKYREMMITRAQKMAERLRA